MPDSRFASVLEKGYAADLANGLLGDFHDVHGTSNEQVRIVIVARRAGTPLVSGDAIQERRARGLAERPKRDPAEVKKAV